MQRVDTDDAVVRDEPQRPIAVSNSGRLRYCLLGHSDYTIALVKESVMDVVAGVAKCSLQFIFGDADDAQDPIRPYCFVVRLDDSGDPAETPNTMGGNALERTSIVFGKTLFTANENSSASFRDRRHMPARQTILCRENAC